jgi:hypothetical protein
MAAEKNIEAVNLLRKNQEEILNALSNAPEYGSIGFRLHFVEGEVVRIETERTVHKKLAPLGRR